MIFLDSGWWIVYHEIYIHASPCVGYIKLFTYLEYLHICVFMV